MGVVYGSRQGVQAKARRSLALPAREVASASASTDRLELEPHGLITDDPVQFRVDASGVLPAPLAAGTVYYAKPVVDSSSLFQVAAAPGGAAIDLTTAGTAPFSLIRSVDKVLDTSLEHSARWIDATFTSHAVPFASPYPKLVIEWNEWLALENAVQQLRMSKDFADVLAYVENLRKDILRMASSGQSLRDATATVPVQVAVSSLTASGVSERTDALP